MIASPPPAGLQVLAIAQGDPLGFRTWSGSARSLFGEFERRGQLAGTVDMSLPPLADVVARALTVHANRATWRERSSLGRARAAMSSALAEHRSRALLDTRDVNVVLQVGSWSRPPSAPSAVRASYMDSAIGQLLRRPGGHIASTSSFAKWRSHFERVVYEELDIVFTMSDWTRGSLIDDLGVPAEKVVVARPGPNTSNLVGTPDLPTSRHPWRSGRGPHLLFVGKKWERKGGPTVLAAYERLRRAHPDALLSVIGPEHALPTVPGLRAWGHLSREEPASARLFEHIFASADMLVMPSTYEPFGMVFVEAMSRGLPCIGANCCAMPEIIADRATGVLVPPGDVDKLAEVLIELASAPETVVAMGNAARARAANLFTWQHCVDQMNASLSDAQQTATDDLRANGVS